MLSVDEVFSCVFWAVRAPSYFQNRCLPRRSRTARLADLDVVYTKVIIDIHC